MSILRDVLEIAAEIKNDEYLDFDTDGNLNLASLGKKNSLSRFTDDAIMQFPVLTSNALSVEDLTMINKALERQYASFVMVAMNLDNIEVTNGDMSKSSYIRRFHTNTNRKTPIGTVASYVDNLMSDSVITDKLITMNRGLLKEYVEDLRIKPLNELTKRSNLISEAISDQDGVIHAGEDNIKYSGTFTPSLVDNDVKKSNELVPTLIKTPVTFIVQGTPVHSEVLVGIKCITHLIPTEEMTYNISKGIQERRGFFRFIQWTSGEIKFFKDYLFCIDRIKREAIGSKSDSSWWRSLKNRSKLAKLRSFTFSRETILPNSTLVITMDEAEYILNNYGIDLINNMKTVQKLMDTFFLLGFVIVDSASEIAYFLFDGQNSYQMFSFKSLEKENSNAKRDMKELMTLANNFR